MMEENRKKRANQEYKVAQNHGRDASEYSANGRETLKKYKTERGILDKWKKIMNSSYPISFFIIFLIVSVVEYFVSKEIYREWLPEYPWVIAIGFFAVGVLASEFVAYKLFKSKLEWKEHQIALNEGGALTEDQIKDKARKSATKSFIGGLLLALALLGLIGYLSLVRVQFEIGAGMRDYGFSLRDLAPVILYIAEIAVGCFVLYLFRRVGKGILVWRLHRKYNKQVLACSLSSQACVEKYNAAEAEGFDAVEEEVSDTISFAFYRKKMRNVADKEEYISDQGTKPDTFKAVLAEEEGNPIVKEITVFTEYNKTATQTANSDGKLVIEIDTYPGDRITALRVKNSTDSKEQLPIEPVNYDLGETEYRLSFKGSL